MSYASIPFETAIISATDAPAKMLGIDRESGTIARGKRADLAIWSAEHEILATIVGGVPVYGEHYLAPQRVQTAG